MSLALVWRTSADLTLRTLRELSADQLTSRYSPRTRTAVSQFAHIHYVRVKNLESRGGPDMVGDLVPFERGAEPSKRDLERALVGSGRAMERLVAAVEEAGKVKSWGGRPPETWVAYHVAHEAHHRALALVSLRLSGHKVPEPLKYGLWDAWRKS
ncbi:MAG: DinB family protein [Planctomycetota bacterium]